MLGPGLGTDAIQYQRHETAVTIGVTENDPADAVSKNFTSRGRSGTVIHVELDRLPFHSDSFDLAYLNALHPLTVELPVVIREIHRILKPGGKVFGLFPARFDIRYWCRRLMPVTRWIQCVPAGSGTAAGTNARELRKVFAQFEKQSIAKRHLKRTELPKLWQLLPVEFLQRLFGHILVFKGLKPIHTSLRQVARAA
jgi:SAM-dependent methyltransferase